MQTKNWKQIEEEFRDKFYRYRMNEKWDTEDEKDNVLVEEHGKDILTFFKPYFQEKMHEEAVELAELEAAQNFIAGYNKGVDTQLYWRHLSEEEQKEILHKQFGYDICQWENCSGGRYCEKHSLEIVDNNPKE